MKRQLGEFKTSVTFPTQNYSNFLLQIKPLSIILFTYAMRMREIAETEKKLDRKT